MGGNKTASDINDLQNLPIGLTKGIIPSLSQAMQTVKNKMDAASAVQDSVPDRAFLRLRGALFFGPRFLVTRDKLTFQDNLQECLAIAVPSQSPQISHAQY